MESFPSYKIYEPAEQELILRMGHKFELESFENVPPPRVTYTFQYIWLVVTHSKFTACEKFGQKNNLFPCSDCDALKLFWQENAYLQQQSLYRVSHSLPNPVFL